MAAIGVAGVSGPPPVERPAASGEAFPVSVKAADASIMAGSNADGAVSDVSAGAFSMGTGKAEASEMQAPNMPAPSNMATRPARLFPKKVIRFKSSGEFL
jgi:hypothetical protein